MINLRSRFLKLSNPQKSLEVSPERYFVVFAGPNGAGKSFASDTYLKNLNLSLSAFDWDKRFYTLWEKFNFDPYIQNGLRDKINNDFREYIKSGFKKSDHLAYETNFHLEYNLELLNEARKNGYQIILLLFK